MSIPTLEKHWTISVDIKPAMISVGNVFEITSNEGVMLSIDLLVNNSKQFLKVSYFTTRGEFVHTCPIELAMKEWIRVRLFQHYYSHESQFHFDVYVDRNETYRLQSRDVDLFENVKVFASSPNGAAANATIHNFNIYQNEENRIGKLKISR